MRGGRKKNLNIHSLQLIFSPKKVTYVIHFFSFLSYGLIDTPVTKKWISPP